MDKINKGYEVEEAMMKWFKGKPHPLDCVDFQTTKTLYEVKSCQLFIRCSNGNDKRKYFSHPHKKIQTTQMGRFFIKLENHKGLLIRAQKENKIPKYIFVITIGKQKIWRIKSWEEINRRMHKENRVTWIRIKDLFNEAWVDR